MSLPSLLQIFIFLLLFFSPFFLKIVLSFSDSHFEYLCISFKLAICWFLRRTSRKKGGKVSSHRLFWGNPWTISWISPEQKRLFFPPSTRVVIFFSWDEFFWNRTGKKEKKICCVFPFLFLALNVSKKNSAPLPRLFIPFFYPHFKTSLNGKPI